MKNNDISYDDLCNLIANEIPYQTSQERVNNYLHALYKVILRQLELNQRINIKNFGTFEIKERKSGERLINNPRNNTEAVDKVASSIKEFGFKVPIIIDSNNVIIAGHTRLKASKKLGYQETFLNGQVPSIPFYEKCGYKAIGEVFYEANIPHKKMIKKELRN